MKGIIPPLVLNRFLQRQPLAIHYMAQCVAEEVKKKHKPVNPARFFLKANDTSSTESRTNSHIRAGEEGEEGESDSLSSAEFTSNGLASFVFVSTSSKQYEDPVGMSEFIGYNTAPRMKRRQRRRHYCCQNDVEQRGVAGAGGGSGGGNVDCFFSSGSCEECRARSRAASVDNLGVNGGRSRYNNYITR